MAHVRMPQTLSMHTNTNTICYVRPCMRVRVYACRGIGILSNFAGPMLKGFLACNRFLSISAPLPPFLQKHHTHTPPIFLALMLFLMMMNAFVVTLGGKM